MSLGEEEMVRTGQLQKIIIKDTKIHTIQCQWQNDVEKVMLTMERMLALIFTTNTSFPIKAA